MVIISGKLHREVGLLNRHHNVCQAIGGGKLQQMANGECGDYSALFTALCRAAGIPARTVVGCRATSCPDDWHVWVEFYLPGYGWLPVDPTDADLSKKGRAYFRNLDNGRLILHKGFAVVLQPNPVFFKPDVGFLQLFSWEYQGVKGQAPIQTEISYTIGPRPPTTTK